jgi:hypothetical protein
MDKKKQPLFYLFRPGPSEKIAYFFTQFHGYKFAAEAKGGNPPTFLRAAKKESPGIR